MPAAVETMMYAGDVPWHGEGQYVGDHDVLSAQAMKAAGLGWKVNKEEIYASLEDGDVYIPGSRAMVRDSDRKVLGIVGKNYQPLQNSEAFQLMDELVQDGEVRYHTAGALDGGRKVFLLAKIGGYEVVPGDLVDKFILLYNSHDGTGSVRWLPTEVRVVCANTVALALRGGRGEGLAVRHTRNMKTRLGEARHIFGIAQHELKKREEFSRMLANTRMTDMQFREFSNILIPDPAEGKSVTRAQNNRDKLQNLYLMGRGAEIPGVRFTGWAAYNAVTEYVNYKRSSKGGQSNRFQSALFGSGEKFIRKAEETLTDMLLAA